MNLDPNTTQPEYTGKSVSYYRVKVTRPTSKDLPPYEAECNDIIEALELNYAEGNALKAIWRMAAARQGKLKKGYTDGLYDAEKVEFFGGRMVAQNSPAPAPTPTRSLHLGSIEEAPLGATIDESLLSFPHVSPGLPNWERRAPNTPLSECAAVGQQATPSVIDPTKYGSGKSYANAAQIAAAGCAP